MGLGEPRGLPSRREQRAAHLLTLEAGFFFFPWFNAQFHRRYFGFSDTGLEPDLSSVCSYGLFHKGMSCRFSPLSVHACRRKEGPGDVFSAPTLHIRAGQSRTSPRGSVAANRWAMPTGKQSLIRVTAVSQTHFLGHVKQNVEPCP
jgi:hypothetical protein